MGAAHFGIAPLDDLLHSIHEARPLINKNIVSPAIVELMSLSPANGKTHLMYYLTALAVLPKCWGGRQAAVVLIDADGTFAITRLAQQIKAMLLRSSEQTFEDSEIQDALLDSLKHVHVFHPQSLASTIGTVQALQDYLFDANRHFSFDRPIAFVAIDSITAFYWQNKSETEDAAVLASTSGQKAATSSHVYVQLAAAVRDVAQTFNAPVVFTSSNLVPIKQAHTSGPDARSFRASLPPPWQTLPNVRLVMQRSSVRKLPMEIGVEDALRESENRQKVVEHGRFECFVNEWGLEERALQRLHSGRTGFELSITEEGVKTADVDNGVRHV